MKRLFLFRTYLKMNDLNLFVYIILFVMGISSMGCSSNVNDIEELYESSKKSSVKETDEISKTDAIKIASKVLNGDKTRGIMRGLPLFDYVLRSERTRGVNGNDTLAYILNYPDDKGFVIVAKSKKVHPVLAYSDNGNFSLENEVSNLQFIDRIESYIDNANVNSEFTYSDDGFATCYVVEPMVQLSLGQGFPWDRYVIKDHPDCPAGCVAVAATIVMSNCKLFMIYHDEVVYFKSMIDALFSAFGPKSVRPKSNKAAMNNVIAELVPGDPYIPTYTYGHALDRMAKFIYQIGQDLNTKYSPKGSGAHFEDAHALIKRLGFQISPECSKFSMSEVLNYLKDNHIVLIRGVDLKTITDENQTHHAWVADGCSYCVNPNDPSDVSNYYIHFDWGWSGKNNGYFSGLVYSVEYNLYRYSPIEYFAVKREY